MVRLLALACQQDAQPPVAELRDRWVFWKILCLVTGTLAAGLTPLSALAGLYFC